VTRLSHPFLKRWLAISRTRIFVAVTIPCLIGSVVALSHGFFEVGSFALIFFGLVMVESANLLMADWATFKKMTLFGGELPPVIEGSPMIPERVLPLRYSMHAAIICLAFAALTFAYFSALLGFTVVILGVLALIVGAFYVLSPVRYGFFSTALLPPIVAFGSYYVLVGSASVEPILACVPMVFISSGVIFTYRVLHTHETRAGFHLRKTLLICIYALAFLMLATLLVLGLTPKLMILGFASLPILVAIIRALHTGSSDYLPATSLGVLLYTVTGILIVFSYILS
jgi:1,4-dihydroxy-2-naphthoate octaprenyltransferase